jgi:hypothetical protein
VVFAIYLYATVAEEIIQLSVETSSMIKVDIDEIKCVRGNMELSPRHNESL